MYDLEVCLPVSGVGKYNQRLFDFKRYGLLNIKNCKIKVVLLEGIEHISNLELDWPPNVTPQRVHNAKNNYVTSKICDYYTKTVNNAPLDARWYVKLDDDSINDIDRLVKNLDYHFDYDDPHYLAAEAEPNFVEEEHEILRKSKLEWVLQRRTPALHEWEACIISKKAMEKISKCPDAQNYLTMRAAIHSGPGDQAPAIAALLAKIHPIRCPFISKDPVLEDFSLFGGGMNHIHYMARDIDFNMYQLLVCRVAPEIAVESGYLEIGTELYDHLLNQEFVFYNSKGTTLGMVKLVKPCVIENYYHPNEVIWRVRNGKLQFIGTNGQPTTIFDQVEDGLFSGPVLGNMDTTHYLRKLIPVRK